MPGPVHWGSYDGEFLEKVMAVYVAQADPGTMRRTPASGDGGIDLMIPRPGGYEVHQVKGFTGRIGSDQRRQIKESWESVTTKPRLDKPIVAYCVVVPVDLTPDEQTWFETLTAGAAWPVDWYGEVHWNAMAARYPHVTDYFFHGGRQIVIDRAKALLSSATDPGEPLSAMDVATTMGVMQAALNKEDPHYRYDLRTSELPLRREDTAGYAMARGTSVSDGGFVTVLVKPRHRYALEDEPIEGKFSVTIADPVQAKEFQEALVGFWTFGRPLRIPDGTMSGTFSAPGGLGGSFEGAGGWIGPAPSAVERPPLRMSVYGSDGRLVAERTMETKSVTVGPAGGSEVTLTDGAGVLELVMQAPPKADDDEPPLHVEFKITDLEGKVLADVMPTVRVLEAIRPPNTLRLRHRVSNLVLAEAEVTESIDYMHSEVLQYLEDLLYLQDLATEPILVPEEIDRRFAQELREYIRMLDGEVISDTWNEVTVGLNVPRSELPAVLSGDGALATEQEMYIELGGHEILLGKFARILHTARLADDQPEDEYSAVLVPGADDQFTYRAGPLVRNTN